MGHNISIAETTTEEWDYEVKLCLNSAFYCVKEAWLDMCARKWGQIVNMTSVAGVLGGAGQSSYGAAKAGLIRAGQVGCSGGCAVQYHGQQRAHRHMCHWMAMICSPSGPSGR